MSETRDNEGAIWPNRKREKPTHPHFNGSARIDGVDYWVNAWKKGDDAKENAPSLKFSFKRKDEQAASSRAEPDLDDDIPF